MTDPMFRRVRTQRVTTPILVLGAEHDGFVSVGDGARHGARLPDRTGILFAWGTT